MKKLFFFQTLLHHKPRLLGLALSEVLRALLITGAAYTAAKAVDEVFLQGRALKETAPVLLVLFLMLMFLHLTALLLNHQSQQLSTAARTYVRQKLHEKLLARQKNPAPQQQQDILPLALEQTDALDLWFTRVLPVLLGLLITLPLLLIISALADPLTGLLMLVTVPIAPFLLYLIGRVTREASEKEWVKLTELSSGFAELLHTLPTLKLFHQEKRLAGRVRRLSDDFAAAALRVLQLSFVSAFALELITTLSIAIIAVGIGLRLLYGHLTFLTAFFVLLLTPEFYHPLRQAGTAFHGGMTAMTAEKSLAAFLQDIPEQQKDKKETHLLSSQDKNNAITASQLTFTYAGSPLPVLLGIDFAVPAQKITAIQGPSGSGKTTLLKLCAGLLVPTSGSLHLPCRKITELTYVPQEPHLFNVSLAENVSLTFDSSLSLDGQQQKNIAKALQKAGLLDWAKKLPHGLMTRLGEGGQNLSQGQRKRLGLARALYQQRNFVLLDEPTAALDAETAHDIRTALQDFAQGRTLLLATHDEQLLRLAHHIIQLEPVEQTGFVPAAKNQDHLPVQSNPSAKEVIS